VKRPNKKNLITIQVIAVTHKESHSEEQKEILVISFTDAISNKITMTLEKLS